METMSDEDQTLPKPELPTLVEAADYTANRPKIDIFVTRNLCPGAKTLKPEHIEVPTNYGAPLTLAKIRAELKRAGITAAQVRRMVAYDKIGAYISQEGVANVASSLLTYSEEQLRKNIDLTSKDAESIKGTAELSTLDRELRSDYIALLRLGQSLLADYVQLAKAMAVIWGKVRTVEDKADSKVPGPPPGLSVPVVNVAVQSQVAVNPPREKVT